MTTVRKFAKLLIVSAGVTLVCSKLPAQAPALEPSPAQTSNAQTPPATQTSPAAQATPASQSTPQSPPGPAVSAKTNAASAPVAKPDHRFYYGVRVEAFPLRLFDTSTRQSATTNPIASYINSASSSSQKFAPAGSFEYVLTPRWSLGTEFYLTHAKYILNTQVRTGLPSPNASTDDRPVTTYVESSKANYWVLPALARFQGLRPHRYLSRAYAVGGAEYRHVGRVRTGTDIYYPDGSTGYTEVAAVPLHHDQVGYVVGIGLRYFDQLGFKLAPEIRYIRWTDDTFKGPGYASTKNQAEASLGFTF